jgi:hypothetical protein
MSGSRIAVAKARAASAKAVLLVSALLAFFAALLLAAWTRPASSTANATHSVVTSTVTSESDSSFGTSDDDFSQGTIAPAQSTPQVATGSS